MSTTDISWTEVVWNPTTGCDQVSPGCDHCYALTMARRLKAMGQPRYQHDGDPRTSGPGFGITEHEDVLSRPLTWRKPRKVFVNSMSDLFHSGVSDDFIARVWAVMAITPHVTYQVLTKRHGRMRSLLRDECSCGAGHQPGVELRSAMSWAVSKANPRRIAGAPEDAEQRAWNAPWPLLNVHLGVSAEDQQRADLRIPALLETPAAVRWVSAEPLLGPIDLRHVGGYDAVFGVNLKTSTLSPYLSWTVLGGESGPGARPMDLAWAEQIVAQCQEAGVPVHVKQLGSVTGGRTHHDIDTFPEPLRVREYPTTGGPTP